jgi:hypothetical protein
MIYFHKIYNFINGRLMKLSKIVCLTIITLLATACTKLKTVDYYKEHIEEAYKVHNKCIEKYDKGDV